MRTRSLAHRAVALVLVMELLCAIGFSVAVFLQEQHTHLRSFDVMLRGRADSLLGAIQDAEDPNDNVMIDPAELRLPNDDVYAVFNKGGRLLGTSPHAPAELTQPGADGIRNVRVGHRYYRMLQTDGLRIIDRAETHGVGLRRPVTILYASPTHRMWHEVIDTVRFYSLVSFGLICVTALILVLLLRRLLLPLRALADAATGVRVDAVRFQAPQSAYQVRELRPLAEALTGTIERLRDALRLQQQFVSDAAHELKTAVAVERSTLQLLTMRERPLHEYQEGIAAALEDNERVEQLVTRMLTLARFEERSQPATEPLDLSACAARVVEMLRPWALSQQVMLQLDALAGATVLLTYEAAETLLSNLVMNAVQHSRAGGVVRIAVQVAVQVADDVAGHVYEHVYRKGDRAARSVQLAVQDFGLGIAPENLAHVFERFYREDRSRSRQTGGAGLGLAICKSIVEGAGGVLQIESKVDVGTTVCATFRLH
jgi:signal transduction histidine kinase